MLLSLMQSCISKPTCYWQVWFMYTSIFYSNHFQDGIIALVTDLDTPALRRNKNVENFLNRCKYKVPVSMLNAFVHCV